MCGLVMCGLVVADEAHHVGATCPVEVLEMLVAPTPLGLTATPPDAGPRAAVERHLGHVVYALCAQPMPPLRRGLLTELSTRVVLVWPDPSERLVSRRRVGARVR